MLVSKKAPNFKTKGINKNNEIINFNFENYSKKKNIVIFFWPLDFTFICPSEIISINNRYKILKKKNTKIIGISIDSIYTHLAWKKTPVEKGGIGKIKFTILSDIKKKIQKLYNVEYKNSGISLRATFIIDKYKIIRHQSINDLSIGRNIDEILRIIDAINYIEKTKFICPAQWNINKEGIEENYKSTCNFLKKNHTNI